MSVVTAIEETGPSRVKVTLEVPVEAVQAESGRVLQELRRTVHLPGFRKGKVPPKVIQRRFGEEVKKEIVDRLLPRYWQQAQAEKDLDPLIEPTVEDLEFEDDKPMVVTLTVETRPQFPVTEERDFDLPEDSIEPTEIELEDGLAELRRSFGEWEAVERAAAQGDMVVGTVRDLDSHKHDDDEAASEEAETTSEAAVGDDADGDATDDNAAGGELEERPLHVEIGGNNVDEELSLVLTGQSAGATVAYSTTHGEGDDTHEHRYEIKIREVREQQLPELDDAFAAKVGAFETFDELREIMVGRLRRDKEKDLGRRRMETLLEKLRDLHAITLPEGVVQKQAERMVQERAEQLAQQGVDVQNAEIDWGRMLESVQPEAEKRVHERLVLDAIAKADGTRLDEEHFESFLTAVANEQRTTSAALRQRLDDDGRLPDLRAQMLREQILRSLLGDEEETADDESADLDGVDPDGADHDEAGDETEDDS